MNGLSLHSKTRLVELGGVLNKIRIIQGWNMLGPAETAPLAVVWAEQLDRFNVPPAIYDELLNRAIDHRRKALLSGSEFVPALSVELFLAMFEQYRMEHWEHIKRCADKVTSLEHQLETLRYLQGEFDLDSHTCFAPPNSDHASCRERHKLQRDMEIREANANYETPPYETLADIIAVKSERLVAAREAFEQAKEASQLSIQDGEWNKAVKW